MPAVLHLHPVLRPPGLIVEVVTHNVHATIAAQELLQRYNSTASEMHRLGDPGLLATAVIKVKPSNHRPRTMFAKRMFAKRRRNKGETVLLVGSKRTWKPSNCRALVWLRTFYLVSGLKGGVK